MVRAPQIDSPENPVSALGENYPPQGFGIIAKAWRQRLKLAGTYDGAWLEERWPDLPEDFDMAYWNGANPDMRTPYLAGGEEITLTNLTPDGKLRFVLPCDMPLVDVSYENGKTESVPAKLDTLIIDPDSMKLGLVWRAVTPAPPDIITVEIRTTSDKG